MWWRWSVGGVISQEADRWWGGSTDLEMGSLSFSKGMTSRLEKAALVIICIRRGWGGLWIRRRPAQIDARSGCGRQGNTGQGFRDPR